MSSNFSEIMSQHSDKKLAEILTIERNQHQPVAIEAAQREFDRRNLNISNFAPAQPRSEYNINSTTTPELNLRPNSSNTGSGGYNINRATTTPEVNFNANSSNNNSSNTPYDAARREQADKDMLYGALWCIGGIIATAADIGAIFWGAIIFGAIQFFKGLSNR